MTESKRSTLADQLRSFQRDVHQTAIDRGWWETPREVGTQIALMHSELSEALEVARKNTSTLDTHCPECRAIECEFADVIIRILDTCEANGWDVAGALLAKAEFNKARSIRHGGKLF